jgi:hypothetical protein
MRCVTVEKESTPGSCILTYTAIDGSNHAATGMTRMVHVVPSLGFNPGKPLGSP